MCRKPKDILYLWEASVNNMDMMQLVSNFSSKNDNKFNDDLLIKFRQQDDMVTYIDDACKAITQLMPEYIQYKGYHDIDNRQRMLDRDKSEDEDSKKEIRINIADTYAKEVAFDFVCAFGGQTVVQSFSLWIPLLIDNSHYYIRGNKYSCPIQIIDAITFTKKNTLVLKTITRAVKFEREKCVITDIYGNKYNTNRLMIYATKKSIPVVLYYFAKFGFFKTIEYFGACEWDAAGNPCNYYINIYSGDMSSAPEDEYIFKYGSTFLGVKKDKFNQNSVLRMFVSTILATGKRSMDADYLRNPARWVMLLGETISIPKSLEKGLALLKTFEAMYDFRTNQIVNELVPGIPRTNSYAAVRWIFIDYVKLCSKDEGLQNKRARLSEYLISPFIKTLTEKVYRFINTPEKNKTMKNLLDVFKIKPSLILNAIIGKISPQITGLNIAKYSSESNDCALVNTLMSMTTSGPGSASSKTKRVGISHRQCPVDYIGAIDIIGGTSPNSPGLSRLFTPCCDNFNLKKKIFDIDPKFVKN